MSHAVPTILRYTLIDAGRSGLPALTLAACLLSVLAGMFLAGLAVTETAATQAALGAAFLRAAAAFLVAAHVAGSTLREAADKTLDLLLALPISRTTYYLGKLVGYSVCGVLVAIACALPLLLWSNPTAVAFWAVSLAVELVLVAATALFFATAMRTIVPALAATAGLYLLSRSIAAIQAISTGPLATDTLADRVLRGAADLVALLLPRLDTATRSEWLLYGTPPTGEWISNLGALALYAALLAAAGTVDLHRRNL